MIIENEMKKVVVFLADGFEEIEAVCCIDILRRAQIPVDVVSISNQLEVTGAHQIKISTEKVFEAVDFEQVEMIVLPGGMPGATNLNKHDGLKKLIIKFNSEGKKIGAICAAPLVLGQLGLLENREAVCFPGFEHYLKGASISNEAVVTDGNMITGNGVGSAMVFALKIVEWLRGEEIARGLANKMLI